MKIARDVCIKYSVFILFAILISAATMVHGTAFAQDETFVNVFQIIVPGGLNSFDIGFVDPKIGRYFLADRTNSTVDEVNTSNNQIHQLAKGAFVGVQAGTNTSGPNGVITANNHTEVWAADGVLCNNAQNACATATTPATQTSRILVIDLATGQLKVPPIDNGGQRRADELCVDPQHHVVLVANDDDLDLFLTFISTNTYEILGKLTLKGTDPNALNIKATDGIEQCQWSPRTGKFYLAVPEVNGGDNPLNLPNQKPGAVLEINPVSMKVEKVFPIDFAFLSQTGTTPATADCLGPQGLAIGPNREILLGCSNSGKGSVIIDERNGDLVRSLDGLNGNDEVWYNAGNNHYFLAGSNHLTGNPPTAAPILGVVDQRPDTIGEDASPATAAGSHSVAVDPVFNQIYVPGNKAATSICSSTNGCIAIFMSAASDPGICGGKKLTDFQKEVCPDSKGKGKPGTN
jgi:hypothetical protein